MTEGELLLTEVLKYSRDRLYLDKKRKLRQKEAFLLANALNRRLKGEPIQYILGRIEFMGLEFELTPDVFIPRPETEILVETVIRFSSQLSALSSQLKILDIGTGSGCIAISLAKFLENVRITAIDISEKALEIARRNALLNNVDIRFFQSDLFSNYKLRTSNYELIISNPPYIPTAEIEHLQPELSYEPHIALDGGREGLNFYHRIIKGAPAYIKKSGFLILEMGFNQYLEIKKIFNSVANYQIIKVVKDYSNIDRVIVARYG